MINNKSCTQACEEHGAWLTMRLGWWGCADCGSDVGLVVDVCGHDVLHAHDGQGQQESQQEVRPIDRHERCS
eukprot:3481886-Rhodomonas_salina.1